MMHYPLPMKQVKNGRPTECQECGRIIAAGELYFQRIENSEIIRQCADCKATYTSVV